MHQRDGRVILGRNSAAEKIIHKYLYERVQLRNSRLNLVLLIVNVVLCILNLASFVIDLAMAKYANAVFTGLAVLATLVASVVLSRARLADTGPVRAYEQALKRGDIIELDQYLVQVWDELCREEGLTLTEQERTEALLGLGTAASSLADDLALYHEADRQPVRRRRDWLLAQARIRANLLQDVQLLKTRREIEDSVVRELSLPSEQLSDIEPPEVIEQLRRLEQRYPDS